MGKLAVRRVIYNGEKYYFESPHLGDGIVLIEGENEHGKSTFMDLIYYGLGGKVTGFNKKDSSVTSKHNEIYHDNDNYVELVVEINNNTFEFTRPIGENKIFITDSQAKVTECDIYRNKDNDNETFSDWILNKLGVEVFDIVQGTRSFKLGFNDLMRLIYHDQKTEIDRVYKNPDNDNFISDSLEVRKAIFEVLIGEIYNEYYSLLGKYKLKVKEYEKVEILVNNYDEFLKQISKDEIMNIEHIRNLMEEKTIALSAVEHEREFARTEKNDTSHILKEIEEQKANLLNLQYQRERSYEVKLTLEKSVDKIMHLYDEEAREITEIEKIRFVNKKIRLFSPNTCPYCLREVIRKKGLCICGSKVDEEEYEKFFYTDSEYLEILNIKKKSQQSLNVLLEKKYNRLKNIENELEAFNSEAKKIGMYIDDLSKNILAQYNSAYIRMLDDRILELKEEISKLEQAEELAKKKDDLLGKLIKLRNEMFGLKIRVESKLNSAKEDMLIKKESFDKIYTQLMKDTDTYCFDAYLGEDYMPCINLGTYRARSASVSKRLMYFLTLLILSVQSDLNYPRFLMIDTPNKEGIDKENLITILSELNEVYKRRKNENILFQIILTTGMDTYPEDFRKNVILSYAGKDRLLKEKVNP